MGKIYCLFVLFYAYWSFSYGKFLYFPFSCCLFYSRFILFAYTSFQLPSYIQQPFLVCCVIFLFLYKRISVSFPRFTILFNIFFFSYSCYVLVLILCLRLFRFYSLTFFYFFSYLHIMLGIKQNSQQSNAMLWRTKKSGICIVRVGKEAKKMVTFTQVITMLSLAIILFWFSINYTKVYLNCFQL